MERSATYSEVVEYLRKLPAASLSWAEGFVSAGLSMHAIVVLVETMSKDLESPLREAEEGVMKQEVMRMNLSRGSGQVKNAPGTKYVVKIRNVLSAVERTRVVRAVSSFCQPVFENGGKFGKNGHAVMNAVRRASAAYLMSRIPQDAGVIEVGPDVKHWMLSPTASRWSESSPRNYVGARPALGPRDVVRMQWENLARVVGKCRDNGYAAAVQENVRMMRDGYDELFPDVTVQELKRPGEYIVSYDSNYDICFSDMPLAMALCGARAWHGCMVRAKGLTTRTKISQGRLDLLGVNFRADWGGNRIDFRHPECSAFGYSHAVREYVKYEEKNGYVWTTQDCHYIYSKGPETSDELLFFSVVRVPKIHRLQEPRFVENPHATKVKLTSVWAIGDELNGVPTTFQKVEFYVDTLNFSKVLEKRRALDHKGDLAVTTNLVRATNVRFWLNGTPVGASERIEARLAEASAVVIETMVAERRLDANLLFSHAMFQYGKNLPRSGWFLRMLSSVFDVRAATGSMAQPIMRVWNSIRATVIDKALSSLGDMHVGYEPAEAHFKLGIDQPEVLEQEVVYGTSSQCKCLELAECRVALQVASEAEREEIGVYVRGLEKLSQGCKCRESTAKSDWAECNDNDDDGDSGYGTTENKETEDDESDVSISVDSSDTWRAEELEDTAERKAMAEFVALEEYLQQALMIEVRIDSATIRKRGRVTDHSLRECTTTRTTHGYVRFMGGRVVERLGANFGDFSAVYDHERDCLVKVVTRGSVMSANLVDGWYYTCDRLSVWNGPEIIAAANYALDYGRVARFREKYNVVLGVPGAGKTYSMMEKLWRRWRIRPFDFLVVAATNAAADAAVERGVSFGFPEKVIAARCMSIDKYLMHKKSPVEVLCVDEFVAMHMGKVDCAVAISGAKDVRLYGDAQQIYYDPFCREFDMHHHRLGDTVPIDRITFMPESHRLSEKMCAIWVDKYPAIYPCKCCDSDEKQSMEITCVRKRTLENLEYDVKHRYHALRQDEKEELRKHFGLRDSLADLRKREKGGLATTHEDQGSTHDSVITVRLRVEYDKHSSSRNPSLYNRVNYVLSDMTRARHKYTYWTLCDEDDEICKRIALVGDETRLQCVREKRGMGNVTLRDML